MFLLINLRVKNKVSRSGKSEDIYTVYVFLL